MIYAGKWIDGQVAKGDGERPALGIVGSTALPEDVSQFIHDQDFVYAKVDPADMVRENQSLKDENKQLRTWMDDVRSERDTYMKTCAGQAERNKALASDNEMLREKIEELTAKKRKKS